MLRTAIKKLPSSFPCGVRFGLVYQVSSSVEYL
jgi:hypothetical protein